MSAISFQSKVISATKWSVGTQIAAKLVTPITSMVLARILLPEAFGVVATITMITSFADMFTDAGFQKYLIQHEFRNEVEKYKATNVAFLINLLISILLWGLIVIFSDQIAILVGSPGLGIVISIACAQLPITAFSSIQLALYRRDFDFKTIFLVRMISIFMPFVVTIPLALLGGSYWSLIIGSLAIQLSNAFILTIKSKWKPNLFFEFKVLKKMFAFSFWSLIEAIAIWLTIWVDTFIIANILSEHYLGIYKTSTTMVNALMALITASAVPILFSALSRLQNDSEKFNRTYFKIQRLVALFVLPLGIGVFLYSDLATQILLGSQWKEASDVIGIWALTSSITIVFGSFCSEIYRAKGRPKLSLLAQMLHLIVLIPTCLISAKYGFWTLVYARSWIRMQYVLVHFIILKFSIGIPVMRTFKNVLPIIIATITMSLIGFILKNGNESILWSLLSISVCLVVYLGILLLFTDMRKELMGLRSKVFSNKLTRTVKGNSI